MKFRSVIIDDERLNVSYLNDLLKTHCPEIEVVATAYSVESGIKIIVDFRPVILFLDIEIRNQSGFDLLRSVENHKMEVILITAHEKYSLSAFKYSVVDYILKPIDIEELTNAVQRAIMRISDTAEDQDTDYEMESLCIYHRDHVEFVPFKDIIRLSSSGGYTTVHATQHKKAISSRSLKETEAVLPRNFFRVHHSHIVNKEHVHKLSKGRNWLVEMKNGELIPVSKTGRAVASKMLNFLHNL